MKFNKALKNLCYSSIQHVFCSACSTAKKASVDTTDDVYTGTDTINI